MKTWIKRTWIWIGSIFVILILISAALYLYIPKQTISTSNEVKLPPAVKDTLLLYNNDDTNAKSGDLYIQKASADKEKIASDVLYNQASLLNYRRAVLFLDKKNDLYLKETNKDKEKLSIDVVKDSVKFSKDESNIVFLKSDTTEGPYPVSFGDLYNIVKGKDKEKLASNVPLKQYALSADGKMIAYINNDKDLYVKPSNKPESEKVSSDISAFELSENGKTIAFINKDKNLYYKTSTDTEKKNVSTENVGSFKISVNSKVIAFLSDYKADSKKGELYYVSIGGEKHKIASDVTDYSISDDGKYIYYINQEKSFYLAKLPVEKKGNKQPIEVAKDKLASDVKEFKTFPTGAIYINKNQTLYVKELDKDNIKIAGDVQKAEVYEKDILYLDKEKVLYSATVTGGTQKIATDIDSYGQDGTLDRIVYATTKGQISMKVKEAQPQTLIENANKFIDTYYDNALVYEKKVQLEDILGIWKPNDGSGYYLEILPNNVYNFYNEVGVKTEQKFEITNDTPTNIVLSTDKTKEFGAIPITYKDKDTIDFSIGDWGTKTHKRVTKDELDKTLAHQKMEKDKEAAQKATFDSETSQGGDMVGRSYLLSQNVSAYSNPSETNYLGKMPKMNKLMIVDFKVVNLSLWVKGSADNYNYYWFHASDLSNSM